jgi:UDP-GlcNAc3NAcA epimerase
MKILTVVGARPQFIKAAVVSRRIHDCNGVEEVLLHTGQHFDENMSDVFFDELEIPRPAYNLGIGGGTHGQNTGRMIEGIEQVLMAERPDCLLVYGDTDSTLAGALASVKLQIPVAHVEAGLRSFNRAMPEEWNRVLTDHASSFLFAPTVTAVKNLRAEGVPAERILRSGDVMYDAALFYARKADESSRILERLRVEPGGFILATVHRPNNTDDADRLARIVEAFGRAALPVVWPVHPRTRGRLAAFGIRTSASLRLIEPVGYLDMVKLERHARVIATDSGGVQKEAFFHRVPCLTIRKETEWVELVELGVNVLVGDDWERLGLLLSSQLPSFASEDVRPYGDGNAAERVLSTLAQAWGHSYPSRLAAT